MKVRSCKSKSQKKLTKHHRRINNNKLTTSPKMKLHKRILTINNNIMRRAHIKSTKNKIMRMVSWDYRKINRKRPNNKIYYQSNVIQRNVGEVTNQWHKNSNYNNVSNSKIIVKRRLTQSTKHKTQLHMPQKMMMQYWLCVAAHISEKFDRISVYMTVILLTSI